MKNYKKLLALCTLLLSACGNSGNSSSSTVRESNPTSTSSSSVVSNSSSTSSSSFQDQVPIDFIDNLNGTYYSKEGAIVIDDETMTFADQEFKATKSVLESFIEQGKDVQHRVTYFRNGADEYRVYLKGEGKYQLALDKKEGNDFVNVNMFMPSIEEFTGSYSAFGDGYQDNIIYNFGNVFNYHLGAFDVVFYGLYVGYMYDIYYVESSYIYFDDELRTLISIKDYDNYEYYSLISEGTKGLINPDNYEIEYYEFYYDPLCLSLNYFSNDLSIQYPMLDVENKTVTVGEDSYSYTMGYLEGVGQEITLTKDEETVKVYPNQYGVDIVKNNEKTQFVFDNETALFGSYTYEDINYKYDYDEMTFEPTVYINDVAVSHTYEIYNNRKSIKVNYDGKDYVFSSFKTDIALLASVDEEEVFFVNKERFTYIYEKEYVNKVNDTYKELVILNDFTVIYDDKIVVADLYYDPSEPYPYVEFSINENKYKFSLLQENIGAYSLVTNNETTYFFDKSVIDPFYSEYTFHHEIDLVLNKYKLNYLGDTVDYTIEPYYYADQFTYLLSVKFIANNQEVQAFLTNHMMAMDIKDENGNVTTKTCIQYSYFEELVGEYYFDGEFGPEKFKLTSDGHFYADTLNSTQDGLDMDVEYEYILQMTMDSMTLTPYPSIIFKVTDKVGIQLVKIGHTLVVGASVYTAKYFFDFRGVYVDETNSKVIEVREDSLYVNGVEALISDISYDDYGTYITANDVTYTFMKYDDTFYVSSNENFYTEYTKSTFDFDSLLGSYTVDGTTYTVAKSLIPMTNIEYGYSISDGFMTYTDYHFVMRNGKLALEFKALSDTIYVYNDGEANVLEVVKPSLPPLPPPPPPLI